MNIFEDKKYIPIPAIFPALAACLISLNPAPAPAAFDDIGLGARAAAMGRAFSAVCDDALTINANPAGLAALTKPELSASYGKLYTGLWDDSKIGQGYFGLALPLRRYMPGVMGASWDELRLTDAYSETTFSGAYAADIYSGLSAGAAVKYLRKSYISDGYTAVDPLFANNGYVKSGFGIDVGGFYRPGGPYALALVFRDVNRPDMGLGAAERLPMEIRGGASYRLRDGIVDVDVSCKGAGCDVSAGAEHMFQRRYAFRAGFAAGRGSKRNVSIGLGSRFGDIGFDYSFTLPIGGIAGTTGSHRLAFAFKFGAAEEERARLAQEETIRAARSRLAEQERRIRELEGKVKAAAESAAAASAGGAEADVLRAELDKSRREAMEFRTRLMQLEEKSKKRGAAPAGAGGAYIVQEGDTLESIAARAYGDSSRWPEIYKANAGKLGRGGEVKPGQSLVIP